jgi:arylsulfatase A-like enzyme
MTASLPLSRRAAVGSLVGLAALSSRGLAAGSTDRPNILWLVSEDHNPVTGATGDPLARTPTLDRLAQAGVLFTHVYSTSPVCAPSRFGILTGIYPESCGPAHHMRANARLPREFHTYPELLRQAGYFCTNNEKTDYNCDVDPVAIWDRQSPTTTWRDAPAGQPFMSVINFMTTHESRQFQAVAGATKPEDARIPAYLPDTPELRENFATYYNLIEQMDGEVGQRLAQLAEDGLADDTIVFHYSDNGGVLPRSKRYCYEEGLRCQLIVYAPPKWQHLLPARPGEVITDPVSLIDLAPTVLALAQVPQPPQMAGSSLLARRGETTPSLIFGGRNRMDERIDFVRTVTDGRYRYIRNYMPHRPWGQHQAFAWQAPGYQSWERAHLAGNLNEVQDRFFQPKPFEEMYDLTADPDEVSNLAGEPAPRAVLERLSRALDEHMLAINDNGFLPESMTGEGFFESRNREVYPLEDLLVLGAKAAAGDPDSVPALVEALASPAEVVRYWGATGLLILGSGALPLRETLRAAFATEPSPSVQIVMAEALVRLGEPEAALARLIAILYSDAPWQIKLPAINALTFIGSAAAPALPAARRMAESSVTFLQSAGKYLTLQLTSEYRPETRIFEQPRQG